MAKKRKRPPTAQQKKYDRAKRKSRYGKNWDEIRMAVYKRDGEKCRACGRARGEGNVKKLNAHHILLLRVSQSNDPRNLITLCDECHMQIESKALRLLKSGGHRKDVVRMTARWLVEKRANSIEQMIVEVNKVEQLVPEDSGPSPQDSGPEDTRN